MTRVGRARAGSAARKHEGTLREIALRYPEAHEDFPWGERVIKVRKKVFVFLGCDAEGFGLSLKLPASKREALLLPFTEPTHYGLGKSGWVTARFGPDTDPPMGLLKSWIDESYRAIAPKKLIAQLTGDETATKKPRASRKKA